MWGIELTVMVVMIGINSVFAAYEIALASVRSSRLEALEQSRRPGAAAAVRMKGRMEASLAVVQLGITLVGVIAAATGGAGADEWIEPRLRELGISAAAAQLLAILLVVVPLTFVTIVFGELVPKVFALRNKEWVCLRLSPVMSWFATSVWPAVWLLEKSVDLIMNWTPWHRGATTTAGDEKEQEATRQELHAVAALARTSRLIGLREEAIIINAARLTSTPVRNIMLPTQYISMLVADDPIETSLIAAHQDMHTRFPVTERPGDPQAIIGYVNFKDIVAVLRTAPKNPSLRAILRPLPSVYAHESAGVCLERMIYERNHIVLVRDVNTTIIGMLTMEDILEELVGEIHDEYDRLPTTIIATGSGWIVGGHADLSRIHDVTGIEIPTNDLVPPPRTLSAWVERKLGHPVQGGETVVEGDIRVVVRKVRRQLVQEAQLTREPIQGPVAA